MIFKILLNARGTENLFPPPHLPKNNKKIKKNKKWLYFLLGITVVPTEIEDNAYANISGKTRCILGLQPRDKAAMLGVKTKEYFLEEFT